MMVCKSTLLPHSFLKIFLYLPFLSLSKHSAMDAFAQTLMKDAVNCDKHSDLQNSVNQLDFEYGLCCRGSPCKHTFSMYLALCTVSHCAACTSRTCSLDMHCSVHHKRLVPSNAFPFCVLGQCQMFCHTTIMM